MEPSNALEQVRKLASNVARCDFFAPVLASLKNSGMDSDDLLQLIGDEIAEKHCYKTAPTEKYYPETMSDYYSIWVEECRCQMLVKLFIRGDGVGGEILTVTSFKKDERHEP